MTAILCAALALATPLAGPPCERGGHAESVREVTRGGHALIVLEPIGSVPIWVCIHNKEAAWNDAGDPYWGGLQMDRGFMATYGADMIARYRGFADRWSPRDQMVVAWRAVVGWHGIPARGYGPWPNTRIGCA